MEERITDKFLVGISGGGRGVLSFPVDLASARGYNSFLSLFPLSSHLYLPGHFRSFLSYCLEGQKSGGEMVANGKYFALRVVFRFFRLAAGICHGIFHRLCGWDTHFPPALPDLECKGPEVSFYGESLK